MKTCPKCGRYTEQKWLCPGCGESLAQVEDDSPTPNNEWDKISKQNDYSIKQNKDKENFNTRYNIFIGAIPIIIIVVFIIGVCTAIFRS